MRKTNFVGLLKIKDARSQSKLQNLLVSLCCVRAQIDSLGRAPLESQRGADCEGKKRDGKGRERVCVVLRATYKNLKNYRTGT